MKTNHLFKLNMVIIMAAFLAGSLMFAQHASAAVVNSNWNGNAFGDGEWGDASAWNPQTVPNNTGGTVYDVTIPWNENGATFNGPELDLDVTMQNLTVINRVFLDNYSHSNNLTVTGSTTFSTSPGHDGEYAAVFCSSGAFLFGTLTNYNSATHTFEGGPYFLVADGGTIGFRGADIITNRGTLEVLGPTSRIIDQETNANAFRNLAVNEGGFYVQDGYNFTTAGDFTNPGVVHVVTNNGADTVFTISGSLTNYDADNHTLSEGYYLIVVDDMPGTATLRFPGADIRTFYSNMFIAGDGASITDLDGNDAFRNLEEIAPDSYFTSSGTKTYTPVSGTLINLAEHVILPEGTVTVQGDYNVMNSGTTTISAPTENASTRLLVNGGALVQNGSIALLGPGASTIYFSELEVSGGIEFRDSTSRLTGTGIVIADILFTNDASLAPGGSAVQNRTPSRFADDRIPPTPNIPITNGQVRVVGTLTLQSPCLLDMEIGGLTEGEEYDQIVQEGGTGVALGGTLDLSFIDGFENAIQSSDTFDILISDQILSGAFANVASGNRLTTSDGVGSFLVTYAGQNKVRLTNFQPALKLIAAVSRKTHGAAGNLDIPLALTGGPTVECRNSGGNHKLVFTFSNNVVSGSASLTTQSGGNISGSPAFAGYTMTVNLTGVADMQKITLTLSGVTDAFAQVVPDTAVSMNLLIGDTSGNKIVNSTDVSLTKAQSGHIVTNSNAREDVDANGAINGTDVSIVKLHVGAGVP